MFVFVFVVEGEGAVVVVVVVVGVVVRKGVDSRSVAILWRVCRARGA